MDRMIYLAMNGAKQLMQAQTVNANNLANVTTTGFKADLQTYQSLMVDGPSYPSRVYSHSTGSAVNLAAGPIMSTGRDLDIAVRGEGYIAVTGNNDKEAYTRAGNLQITQSGQLLTGRGDAVIGNGGPIIIPPFEKIEIANDGTISIRPLGQNASTLAIVDRIKLVKIPDTQIVKGPGGLLHHKSEPESQADASVRIDTGYLEGSNVSAIGSMVEMISLSRQYEMQVKMMKAADDTTRASEGLLRLR